jgi:uncharacterized protein (TIGR02594 family)
MSQSSTPYDIARRLVGVKEIPGAASHPFILWCISTAGGNGGDEVPWCSAFVNAIALLTGCQRTNSLAARSWLNVGTRLASINDARAGSDIVVLKRGTQPWQGHVGFYHAHDSTTVAIVGGNQSDAVSIERFGIGDVLGVVRLG